MNTMSRTATHEYILRQQEDDLGESENENGRVPDEVCRVSGLRANP